MLAKNTSRTMTRMIGKNNRNQDNDDKPIIHRNCRRAVQTATYSRYIKNRPGVIPSDAADMRDSALNPM